MKKISLLIVGLWLSFAQLQAQHIPRFSFDRNYSLGDIVCHSPYSFVLSSQFEGIRYDTYIEGLHQTVFYAKQKVIKPGEPPFTRELTALEMSRLPHLNLLYYSPDKNIEEQTILVKSWRVSPKGFRTNSGKNLPKATPIDFEIKHLVKIPYSRLDYRRLARLQQRWQHTRHQWKNSYTYVLRKDSVSKRTGKAIGVKKVVKVKNGKIVNVQAFRVEQNWLGKTHKKEYKSEPLHLSDADRRATQSLDEFYEQALTVLQQSYHASLDQSPQAMSFTLHQFRPRNKGVTVYTLESVLPN
ncbi:hypothetical protein [Microscilla marina]|uniref:Uncharacterized protein n=1 Tax=Microscilla marina ATCC 23134 TaxID=313606 RepID=A1ZQV1_MICM2|nr:hypothetical protein [Microscilla marina]EAY27256.1 hypothetical protein M23134_06566 [Microscilla marina ATCC 23134]